MGESSNHSKMCLEMLQQLENCKDVTIDGSSLTIPQVFAVSTRLNNINIDVSKSSLEKVHQNRQYLENKIKGGTIIYGVNTGYGGSADVRSNNLEEVQVSLIRHLNAGFGRKMPTYVTRGVLLARANSLSRGLSGARPEVIQQLLLLLEHDIIPVVPLRGSVSASGDLMPTSYIAAVMMGREDCQVVHKDIVKTASQALADAGLKPITFYAKEALATLNASSYADVLGSCILMQANVAVMQTQICTALACEALKGHLESYHPIIHENMPHAGQREVAANIYNMVKTSSLVVTDLNINLEDKLGTLKQDRYGLRTSPHWLGPVLETLVESTKRIGIDLNSTNDNPIIDHVSDQILHCGNFQGTAAAVAMDQARQAMQLCGKLLFAQLSEIINVNLNQGLTPNLAGSDVNLDFGFKGTDTAMASYCAELDLLANPVTNHVLSAELHNQGVNSLALLSARKSAEALEVLQMMLSNHMLAFVQGIELRWLQKVVTEYLHKVLPNFNTDVKELQATKLQWYDFFLCPEQSGKALVDQTGNGLKHSVFLDNLKDYMNELYYDLQSGKKTDTIAESLGQGTQTMYRFVRIEMNIPFFDGKRALDRDLEKIYNAVQNIKRMSKLMREVFLN